LRLNALVKKKKYLDWVV